MIECPSIVTEALSQALEKMAFMMVMASETELQIPDRTVSAEIDFSGPVCGKIQMVAGMDFARAFAENMTGIEYLDDDACKDGLKELVNVMCGLVLPMIASSEADVFDITVPHISYCDNESEWNEFISHDGVTVFDVEGQGWPVAARMLFS